MAAIANAKHQRLEPAADDSRAVTDANGWLSSVGCFCWALSSTLWRNQKVDIGEAKLDAAAQFAAFPGPNVAPAEGLFGGYSEVLQLRHLQVLLVVGSILSNPLEAGPVWLPRDSGTLKLAVHHLGFLVRGAYSCPLNPNDIVNEIQVN